MKFHVIDDKSRNRISNNCVSLQKKKERKEGKFLLSRPELSKCSPRSHPKTRSFRIPDCLSFRRDGLDKMKLLKDKTKTKKEKNRKWITFSF